MFKLAVLLLLSALIVIGVSYAVRRYREQMQGERMPVPKSPGDRLVVFARQRHDYKIYVAFPTAEPRGWVQVARVFDASVDLQDGTNLLLQDIREFFVTYAGGSLLHDESRSTPLPPNITGLEPARRKLRATLTLNQLEQGKQYVQIEYGRSMVKPRNSSYYATTLRNVSSKRVRVTHFGGYSPSGTTYQLNTVTGNFYSAREFQVWYGLDGGEWIEPGNAVTDRNNYAAPPVLWAYFCETNDGEEFIAGEVLR